MLPRPAVTPAFPRPERPLAVTAVEDKEFSLSGRLDQRGCDAVVPIRQVDERCGKGAIPRIVVHFLEMPALGTSYNIERNQ